MSCAKTSLSQSFGFEARDFGQAVGIDEIATVIQGVPGIVAVNVNGLKRGISSTGGDLASLGGYATISVLDSWLAQQVSLSEPFATHFPGSVHTCRWPIRTLCRSRRRFSCSTLTWPKFVLGAMS